MTKISILGCGWLGLPLAKALILKQHNINGSTTSENKIELLRSFGMEPFLINLSAVEGALEVKKTYETITEFLSGSEILIIDIPPKLRSENKENFVAKIKAFIPFIKKSIVKKVLFISSTSVYADDNSIITETKVPNADSENGKQLFETEQLLQQNNKFETTILRFSGLVGGERNPIKSLAGRENLENPDAPINLIHQNDCIGIILKIIETESWNETFNAAAPFHPSRKPYYTAEARKNNLPEPHFKTGSSMGKTIDSAKLQRVLDYQFQMPEL